MSTIVVLVKNVPDTWSKRTLEADFTLDREGVDEVLDEINEFALEQALRLREANPGYKVVALSAGPESADEALRKALSMGADEAILLTDGALAGSDLLGTAWALNNAINTIPDVSLIVAGAASSDGSMGALPGVLAEYRQVPALTGLSQLTIEGADVVGTRVDHRGSFELKAALPAVVSITDKADKPRFPNFKGIMAAKKKPVDEWTLADLGIDAGDVGLDNAWTAVESNAPRPPREAGEIVTDEGDGGAKLVDYLASKKFV